MLSYIHVHYSALLDAELELPLGSRIVAARSTSATLEVANSQRLSLFIFLTTPREGVHCIHAQSLGYRAYQDHPLIQYLLGFPDISDQDV